CELRPTSDPSQQVVHRGRQVGGLLLCLWIHGHHGGPVGLLEVDPDLGHSPVDQFGQALQVGVSQVPLAVLGGTGLQIVAVVVNQAQSVRVSHRVRQVLLQDIGGQLLQLRLRQAHPSSSSSRSSSPSSHWSHWSRSSSPSSHSPHSKSWRSRSCVSPTCSAAPAASYTASAITSKPRPMASRTSAARYAALLISLLMLSSLRVRRRWCGTGPRRSPCMTGRRGRTAPSGA